MELRIFFFMVFYLMITRTLTICSLLLLLCGCSPNSSQEFRREGEAHCHALVKDLEKIENREQLLRAQPRLKKHFESLISLMIEARKFQQRHADDAEAEDPFTEEEATALLQEELRRIYCIEGSREVIESAQQEALIRLDAYERALTKKREQPI
jgi:hypothetical protein